MKTNTGLKIEGELEEIAEFSEEMKEALDEAIEREEPIEDFDYWKPEKGDDEEDIKDRTASLDSISKKEVEKKSNGLKEDISEAKCELEELTEDLDGSDDDGDTGVKESILEAYKKLFKPLASESLKAVRRAEEIIYSKIMLNFNPYYFNAREFSVSLEEKDGEFELDFSSPQKECRRTLRRNFNVGE